MSTSLETADEARRVVSRFAIAYLTSAPVLLAALPVLLVLLVPEKASLTMRALVEALDANDFVRRRADGVASICAFSTLLLPFQAAQLYRLAKRFDLMAALREVSEENIAKGVWVRRSSWKVLAVGIFGVFAIAFELGSGMLSTEAAPTTIKDAVLVLISSFIEVQAMMLLVSLMVCYFLLFAFHKESGW